MSYSVEEAFSSIAEYDELVIRVIETKENYNLLFVGPPASAKTLFLYGILELREGEYFDCTNTTNRILDILECHDSIITLQEFS
jgi:hypothetical protein